MSSLRRSILKIQPPWSCPVTGSAPPSSEEICGPGGGRLGSPSAFLTGLWAHLLWCITEHEKRCPPHDHHHQILQSGLQETMRWTLTYFLLPTSSLIFWVSPSNLHNFHSCWLLIYAVVVFKQRWDISAGRTEQRFDSHVTVCKWTNYLDG